jgi:hypothetical protein
VAVDRNRILKLLAKDPKYRRKFGTTVGDTKKIAQLLKKGTKISGYMAKDGGYIVKKRKKTVKKRKK